MPVIIHKVVSKPHPAPVPQKAPVQPAGKVAAKLANSGKFALGKKPAPHANVPAPSLQQVTKQDPVQAKVKTLAQVGPKTGVTVQVVAQEQTQEVDLAQLSNEQLADVYGDLDDQVKAIKLNPILTRFAEVDKELDKRAGALEGNEAAQWVGEHWTVDISAATKAAPEITDIQAAANMMGAEAFWKCCKITLADLKKYLNPEQLAMVLKTDTGYIKKRKVEATYRG